MESNTTMRSDWSSGERAEWGDEKGDAATIHKLLKYFFFQKIYQYYDA